MNFRSYEGSHPMSIKLRKENTPKRENWHLTVKMYIFYFGVLKIVKFIDMGHHLENMLSVVNPHFPGIFLYYVLVL